MEADHKGGVVTLQTPSAILLHGIGLAVDLDDDRSASGALSWNMAR